MSALLVVATLASAEVNMRHYIVQQDETLSGIAYKETGDAETWLEIQKHNDVPNPKLLMPGTRLQIPESLYQRNSVTAQVIRVNGQAVHISSLGEIVRTLTKGDELTAGTIIETKSDSSAVLQFIDNSRFFISEKSRITLEMLKGKINAKSAKTIVRVDAGSTESRVSKQQKGAKYEVVTPEMRLAVRGTQFLVHVDSETKTSRAMVMEGSVDATQKELIKHNSPVNLPEGLGYFATENEVGTRVVLLNKPELSPVINPTDLSSWSATWPVVKDEKKYRVQLFDGADYSTKIADKVQETKQVSFDSLADGNYGLRVRAIDNDEMEGMESMLDFEINAFPIAPALTESKLDKASSKTVFKWQPAPEADYYHFQITSADNTKKYFSKIDKIPANVNHVSFRLVPGEYLWKVSSINNADGQGPFSQPKKVTINDL